MRALVGIDLFCNRWITGSAQLCSSSSTWSSCSERWSPCRKRCCHGILLLRSFIDCWSCGFGHYHNFIDLDGCHFDGCYRWRWHARCHYGAQQLLWLGFVCWRFHVEQQPYDHRWSSHWFIWCHPLLHYVQSHESISSQRYSWWIRYLTIAITYRYRRC